MIKKIIELFKYGFWGIITTCINLLLMYIFIKLGMQYIIANVVSYIIAVILSYYFNNNFVFQEKDSKKIKEKSTGVVDRTAIIKQIKYYGVRVVSIIFDSCLLAFLHEICNINLVYSKAIDSIIVILITYIVNKRWVFK